MLLFCRAAISPVLSFILLKLSAILFVFVLINPELAETLLVLVLIKT